MIVESLDQFCSYNLKSIFDVVHASLRCLTSSLLSPFRRLERIRTYEGMVSLLYGASGHSARQCRRLLLPLSIRSQNSRDGVERTRQKRFVFEMR